MYGTSTAGEPGELLKMGYREDRGFPDVPGNQDSIAEKTALHGLDLFRKVSSGQMRREKKQRKQVRYGTIGHWEPAFKIFGPHDSSHFLVTNGYV